MAQKDKQLLLKDLCARLPYGVKVKSSRRRKPMTLSLDVMTDFLLGCSVKPYLRPMSSMTEEEKKEISVLLNYEFYIDDDYALAAEDDRHRIRLDLIKIYIDWLNANKFDYQDLIPMELAIEVTKDNNPYEHD